MVKILEIGKDHRDKIYYKTTCAGCESELAFEYGDIWWEDLSDEAGVGRIECPVCRRKVFVVIDHQPVCRLTRQITKEEYESANRDASKRGIEILMEEKRKEVQNE